MNTEEGQGQPEVGQVGQKWDKSGTNNFLYKPCFCKGLCVSGTSGTKIYKSGK